MLFLRRTKVIIPYPLIAVSFNPLDSTTYYIGCSPAAPTTTADRRFGYLVRKGVVKSVILNWHSTGVTGTTEDITATLELDGATAAPIALLTQGTGSKLFASDVLSIAYSGLVRYEVKIVTPAWVTNPTNVCLGGTIFIEE